MDEKNCKTEVFARITGFFRPTGAWNLGKLEEFRDRERYDITRVEKTVLCVNE
ncbi:MAG: anaerobic ribonucleoside-triphosphate reductase [Candidatus Omnitrophica bacterium]|nr:anaerobic ribonucleoside-triphosphate reductase [Candidatus Omnitrophota bacterium]MDD5488073.1 anaerobic ribonucleoside-triphosphate reductase [Candidatus Omnitrophota bacterium]